jgi:rhamnosyltransferase subunit B
MVDTNFALSAVAAVHPVLHFEPKRIVIATIGSLGDLHPCLALAIGLQKRGHQVTIASTPLYCAKVERLGIRFHALRPELEPDSAHLISQLMDMRRGPEILIRQMLLPALRETYEDVLAAMKGADLLIAGEVVFAAPLVAEKLQAPWISAILSPCSFFSAFDPPVLAPAPALAWLRSAGPAINRALLATGRIATHRWWEPVRQLRRELGLTRGRNPFFHDKFSPDLVLALFSRCLGVPQPDWPSNTIQTGFVYYDQAGTREGLSPELGAFLDAGEPPIVFTLGSAAVHDPGDFYRVSSEAARILGARAVFLVGENLSPCADSSACISVAYAPYSELFPRAAVIVHQGGVGTTAQALRAGQPTLIVPYGFDQPDNAARVERMGTGLVLSRRHYTAKKAAQFVVKLLTESRFTLEAQKIADELRAEDGLSRACDAIERLCLINR